MKNKFFFLLLFFLLAQPAQACELCSIFNSLDNQEKKEGDFVLAFAYQYQLSDSDSQPIALDLLGVPKETQEVETHTWQIMANYFLSDRFSLQTNIPLIYRDYTKFDGNSIINDDDEGIGDISLLSKYVLSKDHYTETNYQIELFTGIKLPTGDSDPLSEFKNQEDLSPPFARHGAIEGSLVGGDDLALGTGSYDFVIGSSTYFQSMRWHLSANLQYMIRTEGDYDYRYGNDLQWFLSPGYYLMLEHDYTLALRTRFSGEYKRKDKFEGEKLEDSEEFNMFLGPEVVFTFGEDLLAHVALDFEIRNEDSNEEVASRRRILTSLTYLF